MVGQGTRLLVDRALGPVAADAFCRGIRTDAPDLPAGRGRRLARIVRSALRVGAAGLGLPVRHHGLLFSADSSPAATGGTR